MAAAPAPGLVPGDPLDALRDIHLPAPPDAWPPAMGWWLIILVVAIALVWAAGRLWQRWQQNKYRRVGIRQLQSLLKQWRQHSDNLRYLNELQTLLKQVALTGYNRATVASLTGEHWVSFLDRTGQTHEFSMGAGQVLIDGHYRVDANIEPEKLNQLAEQWIRQHQFEADPQHGAES